MAFEQAGEDSGFKTATRGYKPGYGLVMELDTPLPRKYDDKKMGAGTGFALQGKVIKVLGGKEGAPSFGDEIKVTLRPNDDRKKIFSDLEMTKEDSRFLLEGILGEDGEMTARWAHGAGANRHIEALEFVGAPYIMFENPEPKDGPYNGKLRLTLDGKPIVYRRPIPGGPEWESVEMPYEKVLSRLKAAVEKDMKFRVSQRVVKPSMAVLVKGQNSLSEALANFRANGYTSCLVRTFVPGTTDARKVDLQVLYWPQDIPASANAPAKKFEMPILTESELFASLRDGDELALIEVIPSYEATLISNKDDHAKSTKHNFVGDVIKGLSDGNMKRYAAQAYGPGISINAVNDQAEILGLTQLATRTEGRQFKSLKNIPSPHFQDADKLVYQAKDAMDEVVNEPAGAGSEEMPTEAVAF